jgi:hypothetical protein
LSALRLEDLPARKIRHPEDMALPPRDKMIEVVEHLSPQGAQAFLAELLAAMQSASNDHDLAHVQHVIDSWYRTLVFKSAPGHDERWEKAQIAIESDVSHVGMTIDEVREKLGVAKVQLS